MHLPYPRVSPSAQLLCFVFSMLLLAPPTTAAAQEGRLRFSECVGIAPERRAFAAAIYDHTEAARESDFLERFVRELAQRGDPRSWPSLGKATVAVGGGIPPSIMLELVHYETSREPQQSPTDDGRLTVSQVSMHRATLEPAQQVSIYRWIRDSLVALGRADDSAEVTVALSYPDPLGGPCE